jgi:hypothetical protein
MRSELSRTRSQNRGDPMAEFESWKQYSEFSHFVMRTARHIRDDKNQRFLDAVVQTSKKRRRLIKKDTVLWRAQLDYKLHTRRFPDETQQEISSEVRIPSSPKRMFPRLDRASEG